MEASKRAKTEKIASSLVKCEGFTYCFLRLQWRGALQDCTANKEYYLEVMRRLREAIRQKRIELWKNQSWILHHDNATGPQFAACGCIFDQKLNCNHA